MQDLFAAASCHFRGTVIAAGAAYDRECPGTVIAGSKMCIDIQNSAGRCMLASFLRTHPAQAAPQAFVVFGTGVG